MRLIAGQQVDRRRCDQGTLLKLRLRPTPPPALLARQPLTPMRRLLHHSCSRMAVQLQRETAGPAARNGNRAEVQHKSARQAIVRFPPQQPKEEEKLQKYLVAREVPTGFL